MITIVTPTYNSDCYLEQCILSIIKQNYHNYEHIIIDGGSTDHTLDIIKKYENSYSMKWISEPDKGMYDAINKGFKIAKGEIYAWLNSDDYYYPWTLQIVSRSFECKDINWLIGIPSNTRKYGQYEITYLLPNLPTVFATGYIHRGFYDGIRLPFIQQESCFWSKKLWKIAGSRIDSSKKMAGDYFLWKEFARHEKLYTVHCNLASFRIHDNQKSNDIDEYYGEIGITTHKKRNNPFMLMLVHLYSLIRYRKYVINIDDLFK